MHKTILSILFSVLTVVSISAQTTEFTYQGSFNNAGSPANGNYDFEFKLFNLVSGGAQQGSTNQRLNVAVANGSFKVSLDFGAGSLPGADRFLDIAVRASGGGVFTQLSPRQKLTSAPYSVRSLNSSSADTATNATQLGGVAASQYVVTTDPRMTNERAPTAGSGNYIQNQDAATQASSNFRISGTGTAGFLNAVTQFNLNNNRILSAPSNNLFVGHQSGQSNTTGDSNSFFGKFAGPNNTSGGNNSFFGYLAGNNTNTGNGNAFFGYSAGRSNTTGGVNSFFGFNAGEFSTTANFNSFFGYEAGKNTSSEGNAFFGAVAGQANTTGSSNSFFGFAAGQNNTTGGSNSFFGRNAGFGNTTGSENSFVGVNAGIANTTGFRNSFMGSGTGQANTTGVDNTFLGAAGGLSNTTGSFHVFVGVNAGRSNTTGGSNAFVGKDAGFANTTGSENAFFGAAAGQSNTTGGNNSFVGTTAGLLNTTGGDNTFMGHAAGYSNSTGAQNSFFGGNTGFANTTGTFNSFFGVSSGQANTIGTANSFYGRATGVNNSTGGENSFFGESSGFVNTTGSRNSYFGRDAGLFSTGSDNSFFGKGAGAANTTGASNTAIGAGANFTSGNLQFATAIGAGTTVSQSNTIALGRSNGADQVVIPGSLVSSGNLNTTANAFVGGSLGVGTVNPVTRLDVRGSMVLDAGAIYTAASGGEQNRYLGLINSPTTQSASGLKAGGVLVADDYFYASPEKNDLIIKGNVGVGTASPQAKLDVSTPANSFGFSHSDGTTRLSSYVGPGSFGTRGGWFGTVTNDPLFFFTNNSSPKMTLYPTGNVDIQGNLTVVGAIQLAIISSGSISICRNNFNVIGACSSSLRYKKNIEGFPSGLSFVNKLQPISYEWKQDGMKDVGFGAEDVEKIDPRFVTYNSKGQVEGVKYDRLSVAFVNAFKEQQAQIETQQATIERQQKQLDEQRGQIETLLRLACTQTNDRTVCRP